MPERSFFGAFALAGAVAIAVALWAFQLLKEKNTSAAELLKAQNDLAQATVRHEEALATLQREHEADAVSTEERWQARLDDLQARQTQRLRDTYAQFNQLIGEGNQALSYINELESKLREGGEATDAELERLAAIGAALSILAQQYQRPMNEFAQLGNYFAERAAASPDAPDARLGFIKRIFSRTYRDEQRAYAEDVARQQAYQEAHARFSEAYATVQARMASISSDLQRQADAVLNLADAKKATLTDLEEFFRVSGRTLDLHREMLKFEPEIELPEEAAPPTTVP
jgi:hypothetical protein